MWRRQPCDGFHARQEAEAIASAPAGARPRPPHFLRLPCASPCDRTEAAASLGPTAHRMSFKTTHRRPSNSTCALPRPEATHRPHQCGRRIRDRGLARSVQLISRPRHATAKLALDIGRTQNPSCQIRQPGEAKHPRPRSQALNNPYIQTERSAHIPGRPRGTNVVRRYKSSEKRTRGGRCLNPRKEHATKYRRTAPGAGGPKNCSGTSTIKRPTHSALRWYAKLP